VGVKIGVIDYCLGEEKAENKTPSEAISTGRESGGVGDIGGEEGEGGK